MATRAAHQEGLELRLRVEPLSVAVGRQAAERFAEEAGCEAERVGGVRLAVSEALTNVVLHAYRNDPDGEHHLTLSGVADEHTVAITVVDTGIGMRPRPDSPGLGLGLKLIAKVSDRLTIETGSPADGGTTVRMTFPRVPAS